MHREQHAAVNRAPAFFRRGGLLTADRAVGLVEGLFGLLGHGEVQVGHHLRTHASETDDRRQQRLDALHVMVLQLARALELPVGRRAVLDVVR